MRTTTTTCAASTASNLTKSMSATSALDAADGATASSDDIAARLARRSVISSARIGMETEMSEITNGTVKFDEEKCLSYYPFEGDFGSPGDRTLKDKIVTGRSKSTCVECLSTTQQGERCRVLTAIFDGEMRSYRWCSACCAAFVATQDGDYEPMDERAAIRAKGGDHG